MRTDKVFPFPQAISKSLLLRLASKTYGTVINFRNKWYNNLSHVRRLGAPVISIGGIRAGGSGKTPSIMLLIELLSKKNYPIAVLSRGYKRKIKKTIILGPDEKLSVEEIGDEPFMIRQNYPFVWLGIDADRYKSGIGIMERMKDKNPIFLLDDGFQHRRLYRDIDIVCIDNSLSTDKILPIGFLREPYSALSRASIFFVISYKKNEINLYERLSIDFPDTKIFFLDYKVEGWVNLKTGEKSSSIPVKSPLAICGIARPERFFDFLTNNGILPSEKIVFPDHYFYRESDFENVRKLYSNGIVTTEKDAVRLMHLKNIPQEKSWFLKIRLDFTENQSSESFINYIINKIL